MSVGVATDQKQTKTKTFPTNFKYDLASPLFSFYYQYHSRGLRFTT